MKQTVLLISILCFCAVFVSAQKTVRKRLKSQPVQTSTEQISNDQTNDRRILSEWVEQKSSNYTPIKILEKPRPQQKDGRDCSQGKVVLRVTFLDSGEIGSIFVISGLTKNNTESAIDATKKIKFEPAMKDGKLVSVTKPVEYSFTIY